MLPPSHIAYTFLALDLVQDRLGIAKDADYRLVAMAAVGPDLIDKPLAWAYFYKRYKSAVLFAHTLIAHLGVVLITLFRLRRSLAPYRCCYRRRHRASTKRPHRRSTPRLYRHCQPSRPAAHHCRRSGVGALT